MSTHLDALSPPARARVVLSCAARARRRWQGRRSRKLAGAEAAKPEPELLRASAGRSRVLPRRKPRVGRPPRCRLPDPSPNNAKRRLRQPVGAAAPSLAASQQSLVRASCREAEAACSSRARIDSRCSLDALTVL